MKYQEYNEQKQHGSTDFPIQLYHVAERNPQYVMPLHWHKEFEIIRVISGRFRAYLDNVEYLTEAGDFLLVECGTLHRGEPDNCVYECAVFDLNMLRRSRGDAADTFLMPLISGTANVRCFHRGGDDMLAATVRALFGTLEAQQPCYELEVFSLLYHVFALLYECGDISNAVRSRRSQHQTKIVTELLDWMDANYNERITLADLARVSGLNEKYLCRFFREYTARTPIDYLNHLRVEAACREMLGEGHTVTEAALNSGFNDLSYFSKVFRRCKGVSPREYQRNISAAVPIAEKE